MTFHKACIELKDIEQNYNSIDFKFNLYSNLIQIRFVWYIQWSTPFPNEFFVLVLPKTINCNFSFFFQESPQNWLNPKH